MEIEHKIVREFVLINNGLWFALMRYGVDGQKPRVRVAYSKESLERNIQYINPWWV